MEITIRRAEIKDIQDLSELFIEFIETHSNTNAMEERLKSISNNKDYFVAVACMGNKVIGTAMAIKCLDLVGNCNPFLLVENVVVSPLYRGKGIGKLLMKSIEDFGIENNCNYLVLVSGNKREQAHKFYEDIGFSKDNQGFKKRLMTQI
jgi:GNAT superfamily N-acetyltransferase